MPMEKRVTQKQLQSQRTLAAIRSAIEEVLQEKDFDKLTVKDICDRANIAVGTFYKYYRSKEDIFSDRYLQMDDYFTTSVRPALTSRSVRENLLRFAQVYLSYGRSLSVARQILKARLNGTDQAAMTRERPMYAILDELFAKGQDSAKVRRDLSSPGALGYVHDPPAGL